MPLYGPTNKHWLSAHIFFDGDIYSKECDRVILDIVAPCVQTCVENRWIARYFFIRYSEKGSHVRLRLYGQQDILEHNVKSLVLSEAEKILSANNIKSSNANDANEKVTHKENLPSVLWIPYAPEVNRYGGPFGVALAESFFHVSSEICIALLKKIVPEERSSLLGKALLLMVVLLHAFCRNRSKAAAFSRNYGVSYLKSLVQEEGLQPLWLEAFGNGFFKQSEILITYIDEIWHRLDTSETLSDVLDDYCQNVLKVREQFNSLLRDRLLIKNSVFIESWGYAVSLIIPSYMHMMNNRLGITPYEESYLAYLIADALEKRPLSISVNQ